MLSNLSLTAFNPVVSKSTDKIDKSCKQVDSSGNGTDKKSFKEFKSHRFIEHEQMLNNNDIFHNNKSTEHLNDG